MQGCTKLSLGGVGPPPLLGEHAWRQGLQQCGDLVLLRRPPQKAVDVAVGGPAQHQHSERQEGTPPQLTLQAPGPSRRAPRRRRQSSSQQARPLRQARATQTRDGGPPRAGPLEEKDEQEQEQAPARAGLGV